jgi:hypothetical protein
MTPGGLRAQYLIPNLSLKRECLSIHSSLPLVPRHHAIPRNQRKQSLCRTEANCRPQVPLPNPFEETFLLWTGFFTKLDPQIRLPPVTYFGVNSRRCRASHIPLLWQRPQQGRSQDLRIGGNKQNILLFSISSLIDFFTFGAHILRIFFWT